jgi:peptide/nickel transport system permease protein
MANRLPWAILTIFLASLISFSLLFFAPGNAGQIILQSQAGIEPPHEAVLLFAETHGLDQPFLVQYTGWMWDLFHGNFGISLRTGDPVIEEFTARFPATFILAISAMTFALLFGLFFGIYAAIRPGSWIDILGNIIASTGIAVPSFWISLLMILFFSIYLGVLPSFGYGTPANLILPTIALGFHQIARIMRITRESMLDALSDDYINEAYAKGMRENSVIIRHALRNALVPVVTQTGLDLGSLLGGTVIIEQIFGWPGIGNFLMDSVLGRDFPVIAGFVLIIAFFYVFINIMVDILYMYIDPRIKPGGSIHG